MGPEGLMHVLHHLKETLTLEEDPNLLVGLKVADDATVYRINDEQAVVMTVDFFAPIVDDPYTFGAVAAANAISDIYAMGADPILALNLAAFPQDLPAEVISEILRGGFEKTMEAGAITAGGHTIYDEEPKYGLCVLGLVHPDKILKKQGAQPGDLLYLTKRLGTGIVIQATKQDAVDPAHLDAALKGMLTLNKAASHAARVVGVNAMTDITGFGLLGHAYEMANASGVGMRIRASALPLLDGVLAYGAGDFHTGGEDRNRDYLSDKVRFEGDLGRALESVMFDPQTSGGLFISVARENASALEKAFADAGLELWHIGDVTVGSGIDVTL